MKKKQLFKNVAFVLLTLSFFNCSNSDDFISPLEEDIKVESKIESRVTPLDPYDPAGILALEYLERNDGDWSRPYIYDIIFSDNPNHPAGYPLDLYPKYQDYVVFIWNCNYPYDSWNMHGYELQVQHSSIYQGLEQHYWGEKYNYDFKTQKKTKNYGLFPIKEGYQTPVIADAHGLPNQGYIRMRFVPKDFDKRPNLGTNDRPKFDMTGVSKWDYHVRSFGNPFNSKSPSNASKVIKITVGFPGDISHESFSYSVQFKGYGFSTPVLNEPNTYFKPMKEGELAILATLRSEGGIVSSSTKYLTYKERDTQLSVYFSRSEFR